jgi:hypothetical protein
VDASHVVLGVAMPGKPFRLFLDSGVMTIAPGVQEEPAYIRVVSVQVS